MIQLRPIAVALLLVCGLLCGRAEAHASLVEAIPADGAVLVTAPLPYAVAVQRAGLAAQAAPDRCQGCGARGSFRPEAHDGVITLTLPTNLPWGTQVLSYRVISSDGHPIAGSIVFSSALRPPATRSSQPASTKPVAVAIWLVRLALYIGLFAGVGGAFFALWIAPGATPPAAGVQVVCGGPSGLELIATVLSVACKGWMSLTASFPLLFSLHPWHVGIADPAMV